MSAMSVAHEPASFLQLPNEILLSILGFFATRDLVTFAPTCHHIHALVLRLLQRRLQLASQLEGHALFLDCAPPAQGSIWSSAILCTDLGTDGLKELQDETIKQRPSPTTMGNLFNLFSRFQPLRTGTRDRSVPKHPAGDVPGSRTYQDPDTLRSPDPDEADQAISRTVIIDTECLFTQLATGMYVASRDSIGPIQLRRHTVAFGVVRVFRDWLSGQYQTLRTSQKQVQANNGGSSTKDDISALANVGTPELEKDSSILWINTLKGRNIAGVKFRMAETETLGHSLKDLGLSVHCQVGLQEVIIRTSSLLLSLEDLKSRTDNAAGRALFFSSLFS